MAQEFPEEDGEGQGEGGFFCEEGGDEEGEDGGGADAAPISAPADVADKRREIEDGAEDVFARGYIAGAFGVERMQQENQPAEKRGQSAESEMTQENEQQESRQSVVEQV